jgi:hypothetical protein
VTQTYLNQQATTAPFASREASAAGRLRPNGIIRMCAGGGLPPEKWDYQNVEIHGLTP